MFCKTEFSDSKKKHYQKRQNNLMKAARTLEMIKHLNYSSPILTSNSPASLYSSPSPVSLLNAKLYEFSHTKDTLIHEIHESLGIKEKVKTKNDFHKSTDFIQRKQQIKQNVKENKFKSSDKLKKLKTINEIETSPKDFLSEDDMRNEVGAQFLALNRRHFGQSPDPIPVFRVKKRKTPAKTPPKKLNLRELSLPDLPILKLAKINPVKSPKKSIELNSSPFLTGYISSEMKKIWPGQVKLKKFE